MKRHLLALLLVALTAAPMAAPVLEQCPVVIATMVHPYYGLGWLMQCSDGLAFVVPSVWHRWAILYDVDPTVLRPLDVAF